MLYKINWKGLFLWSNQFYGICAVLLAIESSLQILHKIPPIALLVLIHFATVLYYTHAYLLERKDGIYNERSSWYAGNKKYLVYRQTIITIAFFYLAFVQCNLLNLIIRSSAWVQLILCLTFLISFLYYLPSFSTQWTNIFRRLGILKSITIAWAWTFTCCFLPIWFSADMDKMLFSVEFWLHLIPLFLFLLVLAILFDIKDFNRDQTEQIYTIAVKMGKDRIVHSIILPILLVYLLFIGYDFYVVHKSLLFLLQHIVLTVWIYAIARVVLNKNAIYLNIILIDGIIIVKVILSLVVLLITANLQFYCLNLRFN